MPVPSFSRNILHCALLPLYPYTFSDILTYSKYTIYIEALYVMIGM